MTDAPHQRLNSAIDSTLPTHPMDYIPSNELVDGMVFIGMLFYSTHRTPMENVLPNVLDEKLERELAAELGAR